ncbi:hypothetical protein TEQG_05444 [Trichophyton equinum CBS 127.97]|uniref:Uncharacterized protein n=1 Tax=Trichophyton equinum (strain ATCC MYA-4606 / CBS 127.97) TaxID=559882 RepID=F2PX24_TRIEC|nr:hypothetical protein TEQG_05444 [Trichophyton equinum CBS 127.97]
MLPISKLMVLALAWIGGTITFSTQAGDIIGYRTVHDKQAAHYEAAGTLTFDENQHEIQLGKGVYLTARGGYWRKVHEYSYCAVFVNTAQLSAVPKAWVPEKHGRSRLWWNQINISRYIRSLDKGWDLTRVIQISYIQGHGRELQMLIPPNLLNQNGGELEITVTCTKNRRAMTRMPTIDWMKESRCRMNAKGQP